MVVTEAWLSRKVVVAEAWLSRKVDPAEIGDDEDN